MTLRRALWPAFKQLLQHSRRPIICGPWRGEIGWEALYWVPFIRALNIDPSRLWILTRGGAHLWYPATQGMELYRLRTPKQVRVENTRIAQQTGIMRQRAVSEFDRAVVQDAAESAKLPRYHMLHPAWMSAIVDTFWTGEQGLAWAGRHLTIQSLPAPILPDGLKLPEKFVAVRFYARSTFPLCDATQTVTKETILRLAAEQPVVLLNYPNHMDDHLDITVKGLPSNVLRLQDLAALTPENNLALQSAVLSRAMGFVGTYGGLAQLALLYKKPTVSFYTDWHGTAVAHKHLMDAMALQVGAIAQVIRVSDIPVLRSVLPAIAVSVSSSQANAKLDDHAPIPTRISA